MEKKKKHLKFYIGLFLAILVFPWLAGGALKIVSADTYNSLSEVSTENRSLSEIEWKNLWGSGQSISDYIDDHMPFRNLLIQIYNQGNSLIEGEYQKAATAIGALVYTPSSKESEKPQAETAASGIEPEATEEVAEETSATDDYFAPWIYQDVLIGRGGWLFLYGENEIDYYTGSNILTEEEMADYADITNQLKAICDAQGKELYVFIAPNKSQVYDQYMATFEIENSYKRLQQLKSYIDENTSTTLLYPLTELKTYGYYHQDYYKYDTHWNHYGAYIGVWALYNAMGLELENPATIAGSEADAEKYELYTLMGRPDDTVTHDDTEFSPSYKESVTVNGLNMATECYVNRTTSDGAVDKKLLLIGDSFRVNMMPYLSKDFTSCTFAHRDYYKEITEDAKSADVIVVEAVERYDYEAYKVMRKLINTLSQ